MYYGRFSDELQGQSAETVVEANHRFQVAPWLYVTPDFQYVIRPDGRSDVDDAAVFGSEIGIDSRDATPAFEACDRSWMRN